MSGGGGVATTAACALGDGQPEAGVACGAAVAAATGGGRRRSPIRPGRLPGPVLADGFAEFCGSVEGVRRGRGGGGGVGIFVIAIEAGRCSIETTSAWLCAVGMGGCMAIATIRCNSSESAKAISSRREMRRPKITLGSPGGALVGLEVGAEEVIAGGRAAVDELGRIARLARRAQRRLIDRHVARALINLRPNQIAARSYGHFDFNRHRTQA